ncbi:MAG: hypothetical protein AABY74_04805, partial [Planctomycetota bacterium]
PTAYAVGYYCVAPNGAWHNKEWLLKIACKGQQGKSRQDACATGKSVNNYDSCIYRSYMLDFLCISVSILVINRNTGCRAFCKRIGLFFRLPCFWGNVFAMSGWTFLRG